MKEQPFGLQLEVRELRAHSYLFHILKHPIISDEEYDRRASEVKDLLSTDQYYIPIEVNLALALADAVQNGE